MAKYRLTTKPGPSSCGTYTRDIVCNEFHNDGHFLNIRNRDEDGHVSTVAIVSHLSLVSLILADENE